MGPSGQLLTPAMCNAIRINKLFIDICRRERCPVSFVGEVTGDGYMTLVEDSYNNSYINRSLRQAPEVKAKLPYDLHLEAVLGE